MGEFIKRGYIDFKTLAPVYIGCGRTAGKKEYLFDQWSGTIEILQIDKVFSRLTKLGLVNEFEKYLLATEKEEQYETGRDLLGFVKKNRIPASEYTTWSDEIVRVADSDISYHSIKDINLFVRNEQGLPYIPASGFKGMLRTALETKYYLQDHEEAESMAAKIRQQVLQPQTGPDGRVRYPRREQFLKQEDSDIDVASMHQAIFEPQDGESAAKSLRNQKNDVMRGVLVGDSAALSWDDMCICQKIDLAKNDEERKLNVLREAIKPGIRIRMPIAIDTKVCKFTMTDIIAAIRMFNENYLKAFSGKFSTAPITRGNATTFFLGGGTGYVSKTVTYGILNRADDVRTVSKIIDATLNDKGRREHGHNRDAEKGVSPHMIKCTRYNDQLMQMGACCVVQYG